MAIHDISVLLTDRTVTWQNEETPLTLEWLAAVGVNGSECTLSRVAYGSHTGTHLDAPLHFIEGGGTVDGLDLSILIGPCLVVEIPHRNQTGVTDHDLIGCGIPPGTKRLLLKTENSRRRLLDDPIFAPDFVAIAPSGAKWLVDAGVQLVGVDYLSVGSAIDGTGGETHRVLLAAGIIAVEGLNLAETVPGIYDLICLPLRIKGAEGAPVRAVLID